MPRFFKTALMAAMIAGVSISATLGVANAGFVSAAHAATPDSSGTFYGADRSHPASGSVKVIRLKGGGLGLKLSKDFKIRSAPDLRIWLSEAHAPRSKKAVRAAKYVDLGRLKSSRGEQIYRLPKGTSLASAQSIVIWCRAFGVFFGATSLG